MKISWVAFFALWAVTIAANLLWSKTGGGMIGLAVAATLMRLVGYEKGWRLLTVMPFLGSIFLIGAVIFRP